MGNAFRNFSAPGAISPKWFSKRVFSFDVILRSLNHFPELVWSFPATNRLKMMLHSWLASDARVGKAKVRKNKNTRAMWAERNTVRIIVRGFGAQDNSITK